MMAVQSTPMYFLPSEVPHSARQQEDPELEMLMGRKSILIRYPHTPLHQKNSKEFFALQD